MKSFRLLSLLSENPVALTPPSRADQQAYDQSPGSLGFRELSGLLRFDLSRKRGGGSTKRRPGHSTQGLTFGQASDDLFFGKREAVHVVKPLPSGMTNGVGSTTCPFSSSQLRSSTVVLDGPHRKQGPPLLSNG